MILYLLKRLAFVIPSLFFILLLNFALVELIPGGPLEMLALKAEGDGSLYQNALAAGQLEQSLQSYGLRPALTEYPQKKTFAEGMLLNQKLRQSLGVDGSMLQRFFFLAAQYLSLNFGTSHTYQTSVFDLMVGRMGVSLSLTFCALLLIYGIGIPLGAYHAQYPSQKRTFLLTSLLGAGYAMPTFLVSLLFLFLFSGTHFFDFFPLGGSFSNNWEALSWVQKIGDYLWHLTLPVITLVLAGLAYLMILARSRFAHEMQKPYVMLARAKGLSEKSIFFGHILKNALVPLLAKIPSQTVQLLFTSTLIVEIMFSLDGLGRLGYEAILSRDYPVMFALLFFYSAINIFLHLLGDIIQSILDPRIRY